MSTAGLRSSFIGTAPNWQRQEQLLVAGVLQLGRGQLWCGDHPRIGMEVVVTYLEGIPTIR